METIALRSKEDVKREIEASRKETRRALRDARAVWAHENPAVRAWRKTRSKAHDTRIALKDKVSTADSAVRSHIYQWIGGAALVGAVVGFLMQRKRIRSQGRAGRCC